MPPLPRRATVTTDVGGVPIGSGHPVVVQSMTNTDTADVAATVRQVAALARAGSELVRVTVNNEDAARAVPGIVEELDRLGTPVPVIGDFITTGTCCLRAIRRARARWPSTASIRAMSAASAGTRTSAPSSTSPWPTTSRYASG
jgi:(E)-4-hydroxy-3-methylbut-2-enyl-diphosphate synthase